VITKKILIPMAVVAAIGIGVYGTSQASAASSTTQNQTLADRIASAFNLDPSKVQTVISQYKQGQMATKEASYQDNLNQAVTNGKITAAQETAILAEHNTLAADLTTAMGETGSAKTAAIKQVKQDATTWAKDNNISARWLLGHWHLRGGRGQANQSTSSSN
jgi:predicted membrane-bound mannosyltransferase